MGGVHSDILVHEQKKNALIKRLFFFSVECIDFQEKRVFFCFCFFLDLAKLGGQI